MKNLAGTTLNQYQIHLKVRETGTRILYKAYDTKTFHTVALDVVKIAVKEPAALYELLKKQAGENDKLAQANIPLTIDSGIHDGLIYFVYNFVPHHSLRRLFNKTYSWSELARNLVPVTKAVATAHERSIFHGFLNPTSIIVDENKTLVVFDFGFEQIISNYAMSHFPGSWMNNWGYEYASPEQLKGGTLDCRSDVYSMGMIIYEWLTGETALQGETAFATLQRRGVSSTAELKFGKGISSPVQGLIRKCLAIDPNQRFETMQELSILLSHGALDLVITDKMILNPFLAPPVQRRSKRWIGFLLVMLLIVATIGSIFWEAWLPVLGLTVASNSAVATSPILVPTAKSPVPTMTQASTSALVEASVTPAPTRDPFPLFQNIPLPGDLQTLDAESADDMITVGLWGIGDINRLVTSSGGKYMAVGSSTGVFVYDPNDLSLKQHIVTSAWVSAVEFSADGAYLAAGDVDGLIRLWKIDSWEQVSNLSGHRKGVLDIAFSADGKRLASVADDGTLIQWQLGADNKASNTSTSVDRVTNVTYLSDNSLVVTGGNDFKVNLWNSADLTLFGTYTTSSKVVDLTSFPNSRILAVGGADRQVTLIDVDLGILPRRLSGLQYPLSSVSASPDGKLLAVGDTNGSIVTWDRNGNLLWRVANIEQGVLKENFFGRAQSLTFSSDGKTLFSAMRNGFIRAIDSISGDEILQDQALDLHIRKIAISHNSKYAISQNNNSQLMVWDIYSGKYLYTLDGEIMEGNPFSPNNVYFAIASDPTTVRVYLSANGQEVFSLNGHTGLKAIRFVENGAMVAAGHEQSVHVWSMSSGQELVTGRVFGGNGCTTVTSPMANPLLLITKYDHMVTSNERTAICGLQKPDWMKTYFIDDRSGGIAYGGNSKLSVTETGLGSLEMKGVNRQNVVSVALDPSGKLLAAAFDDNTIHLWDVSTQLEVMRLFGHTASVTNLQFTPDGKLMLSTSADGTIRLWGIP